MVKVVTDLQQRALYFSRAPIPWTREGRRPGCASQRSHAGARRHLGIYAYRVAALRRMRRCRRASTNCSSSSSSCARSITAWTIRVADALVAPGRRRQHCGRSRRPWKRCWRSAAELAAAAPEIRYSSRAGPSNPCSAVVGGGPTTVCGRCSGTAPAGAGACGIRACSVPALPTWVEAGAGSVSRGVGAASSGRRCGALGAARRLRCAVLGVSP